MYNRFYLLKLIFDIYIVIWLWSTLLVIGPIKEPII